MPKLQIQVTSEFKDFVTEQAEKLGITQTDYVKTLIFKKLNQHTGDKKFLSTLTEEEKQLIVRKK